MVVIDVRRVRRTTSKPSKSNLGILHYICFIILSFIFCSVESSGRVWIVKITKKIIYKDVRNTNYVLLWLSLKSVHLKRSVCQSNSDKCIEHAVINLSLQERSWWDRRLECVFACTKIIGTLGVTAEYNGMIWRQPIAAYTGRIAFAKDEIFICNDYGLHIIIRIMHKTGSDETDTSFGGRINLLKCSR